MDIEELRIRQSDFESVRQDLISKEAKLEKIRILFTKKFPVNSIEKLPIEKYVVGKEDSFCYWLETILKELGKIGGTTADKQFGIYYGKTKYESIKKYRYLKKFGNSENEVYSNIRKEIASLLDAAKQNDISAIINNKLSPNFKGKILATYFPD